MFFLKGKSFNIISLQDLVSKLINKENIAPNTVVLTFDDGYKTTYLNAYPILKANSIPATVFLAAGSIKKNGIFSWLKKSSDGFASENLLPMNWEDVKELHRGGIEIGSHSLSHRFLPTMDKKKIEEEIVESREVIGDRIGETPKTFALPFSFPIEHRAWRSFGKVMRDTLKRAGYASCCSMIRGHVGPESNLFCLRRIPIVKMDTPLSFQAKLLGNYSWTRNPQQLYQSFFKKYGDVRKKFG
jgi:peptidoglycan/xylan/chitin deacetylase (PgdA/CDA1 family)